MTPPIALVSRLETDAAKLESIEDRVTKITQAHGTVQGYVRQVKKYLQSGGDYTREQLIELINDVEGILKCQA